jgi:S1-C subfamily serine protease
VKNVAIELSESLSSVVEASAPGVVRVDARRHWPSSGVVWSADGTIVTAAHTIERDEDIEVTLADGTTLEAELKGRDEGTDVAVLRVAAKGLARPAWSGLEGTKVGQLVLALSRPGKTIRATSGIVSALGEATWRTPAGGTLERYLQSDIALQPGFSGGLLVNAHGHALGLDTSGILRDHALAVPTETVARVVEEVLAHGSVRRGFLGVGAQTVRLPEAFAKLAAQPAGLLLVAIAPDSPAAKAGLLLGDVLFSFAGASVTAPEDLLAALEDKVGQEARARFLRGGELKELPVVVGSRAS